jgi:hypothetical protein
MSLRTSVAVLVVAAVAAACTGSPADDSKSPHRGPPLTWTQVELAAGDQPVQLTPIGEELLIGLRHPGAKVVPRLLRHTADGRMVAIPLQPHSPSAFDTTWQSISTDGTRILAIGGVPGGAHYNTRWTVWTGAATGLIEKPQPFNTFGGWGAGALIDAVLTPAGAALLGSWGSANSGLDAAVWLPTGDRWVRQDPAGTVLQGTRELNVGPRAVASSGSRLVLVGAQLQLGNGSVRQQAAVWRSASLNSGWTRLRLPDPGDRSAAASVGCTAMACTIAGYVDEQLALWQLDGDRAARLTGLPAVPVNYNDDLAPPLVLTDRTVQVVAADDGVKVISGHDHTWTVQDGVGPTGQVVDAAIAGDTVYLLAGRTGSATALWRVDVQSVR